MLNLRMPLRSALIAALAAFSFSACQQAENDNDLELASAYTLTPEERAATDAVTCLTLDDPDFDFFPFDVPTGSADDRASGLKNGYWAPATTIRVYFANGSATLQNKVFAYAEQWEQFANVNFVKVTTLPAEVRVQFGNQGNWSYIGKNMVYVASPNPTMALQFTDATPNLQVQSITLHEFGHTLGLQHEQQQPNSSIPWNKPAVYSYYAQFGWSQQMTDENVLNKAPQETSQYTTWDPTSIMQYAVPSTLTLNGFSIPQNNVLSAMDKEFIGKVYSSQKIRVRNAVTNYTGNITFNTFGITSTIKPNESLYVPASATGTNLSIYEQPTATGSWVWDAAYTPVAGRNYKIVRVGTTGNNFTLVQE